jgi:hypothetical protein
MGNLIKKFGEHSRKVAEEVFAVKHFCNDYKNLIRMPKTLYSKFTKVTLLVLIAG